MGNPVNSGPSYNTLLHKEVCRMLVDLRGQDPEQRNTNQNVTTRASYGSCHYRKRTTTSLGRRIDEKLFKETMAT